MASSSMPPQQPYDPRYYRRYRRRSMAGPVVLIGIGVIFLLANMHVLSGARIAWLFATWWPVLLILLGVIRVIEYFIARSEGGPAPRLGGGAVALLIIFIVLGLSASSAKRWNGWQSMGDNIDVNPGWDGMFGEKYEFTQELSQSLPAGGSIEVDSNHGSITVHPAENGDMPVKVSIHRHISADSQNAANKYNEQQKPTITVEGNTLRIDSGERAPSQVGFVMGPRIISDLEIWVPRKAPVQITAAHGDVNVSQRDGDVKISTTHGGIQVSEIKGNVDVTTHKGDVQISQVSGDVHLDGKADDVSLSDISGMALLEGEFFGDTRLSHIGKSVRFHSTRTDMELGKLAGDLQMDSGDLRVTQASGSFLVRTKAKDIRLEDVSGPITVENSHGEVELHPKSPFGDVSVSNHQGAIHVVLPENAGYNVDARSSRGEFETDFPLSETKSGDDHIVQGTLGKGGAKLQLTTDHGSIEIRKS